MCTWRQSYQYWGTLRTIHQKDPSQVSCYELHCLDAISECWANVAHADWATFNSQLLLFPLLLGRPHLTCDSSHHLNLVVHCTRHSFHPQCKASLPFTTMRAWLCTVKTLFINLLPSIGALSVGFTSSKEYFLFLYLTLQQFFTVLNV